jgi:hypothetical protein
MTDSIVKTIADPRGTHRVHILQRADGIYTYVIEQRHEASNRWGGHGPSCGLYDSAETAEREAVLRLWWSNDEHELTANTRIPEID